MKILLQELDDELDDELDEELDEELLEQQEMSYFTGTDFEVRLIVSVSAFSDSVISVGVIKLFSFTKFGTVGYVTPVVL